MDDGNIDKLDIHPVILDKLKHGGVSTLSWLVFATVSEIQKVASLTINEANLVKTEAAQAVFPLSVTTCYDALQENECKISTKCSSIDKILDGGLLSQGITELTGDSACGKTQLCLQLSLSCQTCDSHRNKTLFICTEDKFPSRRFYEMIKHLQNAKPTMKNHRFGDHVYVEHIADADQLLALLQNRAPTLLQRGDVRMIIIDSLTALYRGQDEVQTLLTRSQSIGAVGTELHRLAAVYNICVLCVNQVMADMNPFSTEKSVPALGLTWANLVTCRLRVKRSSPDSPVRILAVKFAPHIPEDECPYIIDDSGVVDVPG